MDKKLIESMKGRSREERAEFFNSHKSELMEDMLGSVNGGGYKTYPQPGDNPNSSECPYALCWFSSPGYICNGEVLCN